MDNKSQLIYSIIKHIWVFIKPYSVEMNGSVDEINRFHSDMTELSHTLLEKCDDYPERKFVRDLVLACNNYYQARFKEGKSGR